MTENKYKSPQASKQLWNKSTLKSILFCGLIVVSLIGTNEVFGAVKQDNSMDDPLITLENAYNTSKLVKGGLQEKDFEIFEKLLTTSIILRRLY